MANDLHHLDTEKLTPYLEATVEGFLGPMTAEKFKGGQSNPTFLITATSGQYVLRRQPPGLLLKSAHAVDREFKVLEALADTAVPVAKAYHLCEDTTVIGSMFYVMSFENGEIFWDPSLTAIPTKQRRDYFDEIIRIMAAMHAIDVNDVGLANYGRAGNYFERQIGVWTKQYRAAETDTIPAMETLISWLPAHCPEDDGQVSLVHGDFRIDNIMFAKGKPEALAILDWELSTLGHPWADLAYFCMCLRLPSGALVPGLAGLNLSELGLPNEAEIVQGYCQRRNIDRIPNWSFYLAFSFFRLAAIAQGVLKRALNGNASNKEALNAGQMTGVLAQMAVDIIKRES